MTGWVAAIESAIGHLDMATFRRHRADAQSSAELEELVGPSELRSSDCDSSPGRKPGGLVNREPGAA